MFVTAGRRGDEIWTVSRHDPDHWRAEMVMLAPEEVAMHLVLALRPEGHGCAADVRYVKTSLGRLGEAEIQQFTESAWQRSMTKWECEMNDHLRSLSPSSR